MAKVSAFPLAANVVVVLLLLLLAGGSTVDETIHDVLQRNGLPPGLLPKAVKSFNLSSDGGLEVFLEGPCLTKYEDRVFFDSVVKANLSYGQLSDVSGFSQLELFVWLPVKDIVVSDPASGLILFDIVVAQKQLSLSLFEDPPDCKPGLSRLPSFPRSFLPFFSLS